MGTTYTTATQRDARPGPAAAFAAARLGRRGETGLYTELLLAATSAVVALALLLAYAGRISLFNATEAGRPNAAVINLNVLDDQAALDPLLTTVFASADDRRTAAARLSRFLADERSRNAELPNVGALGRVFAAADVAALKPHFVVRTRGEFRNTLLLWSIVYLAAFQALALFWRIRRIPGDRVLLSIAHLLTGLGFAILVSRSDPLRDTLLFVRYAEATVLGVAIMGALSCVDFTRSRLADLSYVPLAGALSLSLLLVVFGSGPGASSAKVNLGPLQPVELTRLLLALFLAGYFARRWELLRVRGTTIRDRTLPAWINAPRLDYVLPVVVGVGAALTFFFLQRDLGPALLLCCVFLAIYAVARGRTGMALAGFAILVLGFYVGYRLNVSSTLAQRVRMWQSPWDNAAAGGDQVAHALWALASGGGLGAGLGLGDTRYLPAGHTDLVLAAIGEELGIAGLVLVAALYALVVFRGFRIARRASSDYGFFLAAVLTLFLVVPVLLMASGILGVTPLTGVVTPFLSYGGSAMLANFAALGILASLRTATRPADGSQPFVLPMRVLGASFAVCALVLIAVLINVQIVRADAVVIRAHLGMQGDGGRRFEYNPRLVDVVRQLPRGTIYDRRGVPLASDDRAVLTKARQAYERLGISVADTCVHADERCYPLGGRAFHLLGDVRTRVNWSAANTSYVERDAEDRLRGFDDHATVVQTTNASGRSMTTVRRDYRDILPAFRHRRQPDHPAVVALRNQPRDVTLTIDAAFQLRVSDIVAAYARKAGTRAAAVVVDPDTGDLLASASYPWVGAADSEGTADSGDPLLDRARYGLYPPGSTFKLVTAAAALRQNSGLTQTAFTCARLADGRVGARIKGWNRPIRDDVLDSEPHGTIEMHDAMVHSCNAYFGQLALKLGPAPLIETAAKLGISLTPSAEVNRHVSDTLPQIGYGQAEVVATPLRMARVAAAAAADGTLHETRWVRGKEASPTDTFLSADAARILAGYMRDVVMTGTGRRLRDHPWRIAGKTGTAELSGQPSHSWFVGFAPFGASARRIAFAVIIENAGYGAASAAPAAGDIGTAAAAAGLIK
jgi:cell division protein FtsW (lipid II flippase)